MRAFIAIRFNEPVIRVLAAAQDELRTYDKYANYTRRENLHLTLAFIGETDRTDDIVRIMENCAGAPFSIAICGSGDFGGELFWAGIENAPALAALAKHLQKSLSTEGFDIQRHSFVPHITLARQVRRGGGVRLNIPKTLMTVGSISLMKSERIGGKLVYSEVKRVEMK